MPTTETGFFDTIDRAEQMINVAISELTRHAATLQNRANAGGDRQSRTDGRLRCAEARP
jgi:hypothetical protein